MAPRFFLIVSLLALSLCLAVAEAFEQLDWHTTQYRLEPGYRYYINMHSHGHRLPLHCSAVVAGVEFGRVRIQHVYDCPMGGIVFATGVYVDGQLYREVSRRHYGYGSPDYDTTVTVEYYPNGLLRIYVDGQEVASISMSGQPIIRVFTESRGIVWRMESSVEITREQLNQQGTPQQIIGQTSTTTTTATTIATTATATAAQELASTITANPNTMLLMLAVVLLVVVLVALARR